MQTTRGFIQRFFILFSSLCILSIPLPYSQIIDTGTLFSPFTEHIVLWVGDNVLHIRHSYIAKIVSDATGMYILVFINLVISIIVSGISIYYARKRQISSQFSYYFNSFISYYLALQLFKYGFDKVFKQQFYFPEPNTLFTPLAYLDKDILFWSSMGSSYSYSLFLGIAEIIPACLLLFNRTRILGGIIALIVMLQVVAINLSFDISVKLYSLFLLMLSLGISWPGLVNIFQILILHKTPNSTSSIVQPSYLAQNQKLSYVLIKALVISLIFYEASFKYFQNMNFNGDHAARPFLHGAYSVTTPNNNYKRIFIHSRGYLIFQDRDDQLKDYRLKCNLRNKTLYLSKTGEPEARLQYQYDNTDSCLVLSGVLNKDSIKLIAKLIDTDTLPLKRDGFHWTIEGSAKQY